MRRIFWPIAASVNGFLLVLVTVGFLGAYLPPGSFWWAAMAAVALPYAAVALAASALSIVLFQRWGWVFLNAILLLLMAVRLGAVERLAPRPPADPGDLILMTFNVPRHGETAEGLARDVYDLVEQEGPDLVALQGPATWRRPERAQTARVADYVRPVMDSLGYALSTPNELPTGGLSQPVLIRHEGGPVAVEPSRTSFLGRGDDPQASVYVRTRLAWDGQEAVLYNLHLRGFGPEKPWEAGGFPWLQPKAWAPFIRRYRQAYRLRAEEVRTLRAQIEEETLPVILVGDFNATPHNWEYRQLARGRTDAWNATGRGWGGTYHSGLPLVRIDFVLADPAFEVVAAEVPDVQFSDHRPLVVRLRWRHDNGREMHENPPGGGPTNAPSP